MHLTKTCILLCLLMLSGCTTHYRYADRYGNDRQDIFSSEIFDLLYSVRPTDSLIALSINGSGSNPETPVYLDSIRMSLQTGIIKKSEWIPDIPILTHVIISDTLTGYKTYHRELYFPRYSHRQHDGKRNRNDTILVRVEAWLKIENDAYHTKVSSKMFLSKYTRYAFGLH